MAILYKHLLKSRAEKPQLTRRQFAKTTCLNSLTIPYLLRRRPCLEMFQQTTPNIARIESLYEDSSRSSQSIRNKFFKNFSVKAKSHLPPYLIISAMAERMYIIFPSALLSDQILLHSVQNSFCMATMITQNLKNSLAYPFEINFIIELINNSNFSPLAVFMLCAIFFTMAFACSGSISYVSSVSWPARGGCSSCFENQEDYVSLKLRLLILLVFVLYDKSKLLQDKQQINCTRIT